EALGSIGLGEPLPLSAAEQVSDAATLSSLEEIGLVRVAGSGSQARCSLGHPLYGEVILDQLGGIERRRLVKRLADAVHIGGDGGDEDLLRTVTWRLEAGQQVPVGSLHRAAELANDRFDPALAERLAQAAVDGSGGSAAVISLATAKSGLRKFGEAEALLAAAEQTILATEDLDLRWRYLNCRFGVLHDGLRRRPQAVAILDRFEAAHEGVADDEARLIRGLLSSYRASIALDVGELSEVLDRTGPVLADPAALPISELIALEGAAEAMAYRGETVAARALHDRMRELGDSGSPDV